MLKKMSFKKFAISSLLLLLAFILYNYPEEINKDYDVPNKNHISIYLIDDNNFVAMTKVASDKVEINDKIEQIISALTIDGASQDIPNGFRAIIPKGTSLKSYHLNDGLLKLDFSKEFLNINKEDENKMIESLVFSLIELDGIDKIMIFVEGERLNELPNSKKKIGLYLDKSYGINKVIDINSVKDTSMVTIYYLAKNDDYYFVPVSFVNNKQGEKIDVIIQNLKTNSLNNSNLLSHLDYQVDLINYEITEGEIRLYFNEVLLDSVYNDKLIEEVKYAMSYSIRDTLGIGNILFIVNDELIDEFKSI